MPELKTAEGERNRTCGQTVLFGIERVTPSYPLDVLEGAQSPLSETDFFSWYSCGYITK